MTPQGRVPPKGDGAPKGKGAPWARAPPRGGGPPRGEVGAVDVCLQGGRQLPRGEPKGWMRPRWGLPIKA